MTVTNIGLMIGKFAPMHKGHKFAIMEAAQRCHKLIVLLCLDHIHDPDIVSMTDREIILRAELEGHDNIEVQTIDCTSFPYASESDLDVSKYWAKALYERFPQVGTLFGSEDYIKYMADNWPACNGVRHEIIDIDRVAMPVSATMIRENPSRYWDYIVESAKPYLTKNVLVIGSESCGKSTLVKNLGKLLKAPTVPEMYRSMFPEKGMDFHPMDLVEVAKTQNLAAENQFSSPLNKGIIIHDTCNDVTAAYCREYYPDRTDVLEMIEDERDCNEVSFELVLFCDIDVPWEQDGTRTIGGEKDRKRMRDTFFNLAAAKARRNNCPLVVLPPDYKRLPAAMDAVESIL